MDLLETSRSEKRKTFFAAVGLATAIMLIGGPAAVQAATTVVAKIKDSGGGKINATAIPAQGLTDVPGSSGAVDTRHFAGGAGVLGAAFCHAQGNVASVPGGAVVTDVLVTGTDGEVKVASSALPQHPAYPGALLTIRVDANNPNVIADLASGLGVTAPVTFTASGTDCQVIVLGHGAMD